MKAVDRLRFEEKDFGGLGGFLWRWRGLVMVLVDFGED